MEVRDPLHGAIAVGDDEVAVVDHAFVQRLRGIKQMGFSELPFPGAVHSCYVHSLGVMELAGRAFNMGGGPSNALSLREVLGTIASLTGRAPQIEYGPWRVGDQRWYVSDTQAFRRATGWAPAVDAQEGIARLHEWLVDTTMPSQARVPATSRTHAA